MSVGPRLRAAHNGGTIPPDTPHGVAWQKIKSWSIGTGGWGSIAGIEGSAQSRLLDEPRNRSDVHIFAVASRRATPWYRRLTRTGPRIRRRRERPCWRLAASLPNGHSYPTDQTGCRDSWPSPVKKGIGHLSNPRPCYRRPVSARAHHWSNCSRRCARWLVHRDHGSRARSPYFRSSQFAYPLVGKWSRLLPKNR
jgi:hypothetical protein